MKRKEKLNAEAEEITTEETPAEDSQCGGEELCECDAAQQHEPAVKTEEDESLHTQYLRLRADFDNFRKRTQRERSELFLYANESLIEELLPVMDHFEIGIKSAESHETDKPVIDGFKLVYDQLINVLKKFNATPIDAVGQTFDPHRHEAITHLPSNEPAEMVIEQTRRGWMLGEKLLRAAQVVVSSGPAE
ncbi:MAG: nucleotide exchange factor GrpE [Kiritimatiellales bacterium]